MTDKPDLLLAPGEDPDTLVYDRGNPIGCVRHGFAQAQRRIGYELGRAAEREAIYRDAITRPLFEEAEQRGRALERADLLVWIEATLARGKVGGQAETDGFGMLETIHMVVATRGYKP